MPSTDGSVVIGIDMKIDDAEKQLAGLKKKIQDIQSDIEFKKFRKDAMLERTKQLGAELDKAKAKLNEMETATKGAFSKEAIKEQSDIVKGIQKEFDRVAGDVEKCDQAIEDANISLDYMKQKYGEVAREAERLREAQSGAGAAGSGGAQRISGMENARSRMSEVSKSFRQTLADAAKSGVAAFGAALKRVPGLTKSAFSKGEQFIRSFGKSAISAAKNLNVFTKLAESIGPKLSRLGKMIRRVFVFSVITTGLRALRSQLSSYLSVNTELQNALARLKGAFLTAFQPIYEYVVPALTSLINVLTQAMAVVAQFVAALFGTTAKQAQENAKALNQQAKATEAAGGAAEEAGKALASFDTIEKLSVPSASGGGGAAAENAPVFDLELDDTVFKSWGEAFDAFLDSILNDGIPRLKKGIDAFAKKVNDFSANLLEMFTFPGVKKKIQKAGKQISKALNNLFEKIKWKQLGEALGAGIDGVFSFLTSAIYGTEWDRLGNGLADVFNGLASRINWKNFGALLWSGFKIGIETLAGFITGLDMPLLARAASNLITGFFQNMKDTIDKIRWGEIGQQIGAFLANLDWTGIINSVYEAMLSGIAALKNLVTGFLFSFGEEMQPVIGIVNAITDLITGLITTTKEWADGIDLTPLSEAFSGILQSVEPLINAISGGLLWAYENVLLPLTGWVIEEAAPASVDLLTAAFDLLNAILSPVMEGIKALWDALHPVIKWIEETAIMIINWFREAFEKVAKVFEEKGPQIQRIFENLGIIIGRVWDVISPILDKIREKFGWVFDFISTLVAETIGVVIDVLDGLLEFISGVFTGDWEKAWGGLENIVKGIFNFDKWFEIGKQMIDGIFGGLADFGKKIAEWGSSFIQGVKDFFGIASPSKEFEELGGYMMLGLGNGTEDETSAVVSVFGDMFKEIQKLCAEAVKDMTERFVEFLRYLTTEFARQWNTTWQQLYNTAYQNIQKTISAIDALKAALASIERNITIRITTIKEEISSGISSGARASTYALPAVMNIPIPALAQGTVIPPNREFMAVLGDNKTETEVVSPLSTIEQAVENAMRKVGFGGGQGAVFDISVYLDGETIYRNQQKIARQHGPSFAVTGG